MSNSFARPTKSGASGEYIRYAESVLVVLAKPFIPQLKISVANRQRIFILALSISKMSFCPCNSVCLCLSVSQSPGAVYDVY